MPITGVTIPRAMTARHPGGGALVRAGDEEERLMSVLHEQASVDPLTGLVTRRALVTTAVGR